MDLSSIRTAYFVSTLSVFYRRRMKAERRETAEPETGLVPQANLYCTLPYLIFPCKPSVKTSCAVNIEFTTMPPKAAEVNNEESHNSFSRGTRNLRDLFSIPTPLKRLFDLVPVVVYPPNQLPQRAPKSSRVPSLYIFSTAQDAAAGRPSFNPSCLKWQVSALKFTWESLDLKIW
jgi:hypothetical protein